MSGFAISKETFDCDYTVVADGVYMISERHKPGGVPALFDINNRGFIFVVENKQAEKKRHLLMSGLPAHHSIPKAKKVQEVTGLPLTLVVSSGDYHHMAMKDWLDAFPEAKFVHSSLKFPTTRNGKDILSNEAYKARIALVEGPDFPMLEPYKDTVQFIGFNQFLTAPDPAFSPANAHDQSKQKIGKWSFLSKAGGLKMTQRFLAIWTYHVPSKQLIYEHNFNFFFSAEHHKQLSFPFNFAFPKEKVISVARGPAPKGPTDLQACQEHCHQMARVLALDVRAMLDYHSLPATMPIRFTSQADYKTRFGAILSATGEHEADGTAFFASQNRPFYKCC